MNRIVQADITVDNFEEHGYAPVEQILVDFPEHQLKALGIVPRKAVARVMGADDVLVAGNREDGSEYVMDPPDGDLHVLAYSDDETEFDGCMFYDAATFEYTWRWV